MKKYAYGNEAREFFLKASEYLVNPVRLTLGPKGKNVIINDIGSMAYSTKDGVTVARSVESIDPFISAGIDIIRQVAAKTAEDAGDGTTTATILAHWLILAINKALERGGDIRDIKKELTENLKICVEFIKKSATPLVGDELDLIKLKQIAAISANNDEAIGDLFYEAYKVIGKTGTVLLEKSKKSETYIDPVKGMKQDRGYVSPYFVTEPEKCVYENPVFFVTDKNITQQKDIQKVVEFCFSKNFPLIIFSAEINGEALGFLNLNKINHNLKVCAVTIPAWFRSNKEILKDIAIYTGAKFCSEDNGFNIDNITTEQVNGLLGYSSKFTCSPKDSIIIGGAGVQDEINSRIATIEAQITPEISDYDKESLQARKSKLNGGIAVLYAGGATEVERKETMARCEDSVLAVRSALEEGYTPGGGKMYLACSELVKNSILYNPLRAIMTQICLNADVVPDSVIDQIGANSALNFGYNAKTETLEDLCEAGVVDSAKVVRVALENAVSIGLAFLSTDCIIAEFDHLPSSIQE